MPTKYTLNVSNHSTEAGTFCVFQEAPESNAPDGHTVAWLAKSAHPTTTLEFVWQTDYSFVWASSTDTMEPGSVIKTGQAWDANLTTLNQVELDYSDNSYTFSNQTQGEFEGNLYINESQRVQLNGARVGIGMSGKGTFFSPSQPNVKLIFTPKPAYWLVFGNFEEGEILNMAEVMNNALKLTYDGTTVMNVVLTAENAWQVLSN